MSASQLSFRSLVLLLLATSLVGTSAAYAASMTFVWSPNAPEEQIDGYRLYYGTGPDLIWGGVGANEGDSPIEIPLAMLSDPQAPTFTLSGLPTCQVYHFASTAYRAAEESGKSDIVVASVLAKPTDLQVTAGLQAGALSISWGSLAADDSGSVAGYRVYYDTDAGEPYEGSGAAQGPSPIELAPGQTALQLTGLPAGATIYVKVEATCADGSTAAADEVTGSVGQPFCGNGLIEPGETCDPSSSCPAGCSDGNACTSDQATGSATNCNLSCSYSAITTCASGDGCCPPACNNNNDSDCSISCGNGLIEPGETCDPPSSCPTSCDDGNGCTVDVISGSAAHCSAGCNHTVITTCFSGDGCCPAGCDPSVDSDCSQSCGNGTLEVGETCDPPGSCPTSCDEGDACTADQLTGNPLACSASCSHNRITACESGDGCCPPSCLGGTDSDCQPGSEQDPEDNPQDPGNPGPNEPGTPDERQTLSGGCSLGGTDPGCGSEILLGLLALLLWRRRR